MGTCATCEEFQGEEMGIEDVEWYRWWKWTWKIDARWRRWKHDRQDHYWQWKEKLRISFLWNWYYTVKWGIADWRIEKAKSGWGPTVDKQPEIEFCCPKCDNAWWLSPPQKTCKDCGGPIYPRKSKVEDFARLQRRLDEEKENEDLET